MTNRKTAFAILVIVCGLLAVGAPRSAAQVTCTPCLNLNDCDGDGKPNANDSCPCDADVTGPMADPDNDGINSACDSCPIDTNTGQDHDCDGIDTACDPDFPSDQSCIILFAQDQCFGVCDPQQGCLAEPRPSGARCDDGVACTSNDTCEAGVCIGRPCVNVTKPTGSRMYLDDDGGATPSGHANPTVVGDITICADVTPSPAGESELAVAINMNRGPFVDVTSTQGTCQMCPNPATDYCRTFDGNSYKFPNNNAKARATTGPKSTERNQFFHGVGTGGSQF